MCTHVSQSFLAYLPSSFTAETVAFANLCEGKLGVVYAVECTNYILLALREMCYSVVQLACCVMPQQEAV